MTDCSGNAILLLISVRMYLQCRAEANHGRFILGLYSLMYKKNL